MKTPTDPLGQTFQAIDARFDDLEGAVAALTDLAVSRAFALNHLTIAMSDLTEGEAIQIREGDLMPVVRCWERRIAVLQARILAQGGLEAPDRFTPRFAAGYDRIRRDFNRAVE